jgi:hypothetical protein
MCVSRIGTSPYNVSSTAPAKPQRMRKSIRRIVTGHDDAGRAIIVSDGPPDRVQSIGNGIRAKRRRGSIAVAINPWNPT